MALGARDKAERQTLSPQGSQICHTDKYGNKLLQNSVTNRMTKAGKIQRISTERGGGAAQDRIHKHGDVQTGRHGGKTFSGLASGRQ